MDNDQEQKDWEHIYIKRLKRGGMSGMAAQALFYETYGNGHKINLTENPEREAQTILLRRLSGKA